MSEHLPVRIWQERHDDFSYTCSCGMVWKHQPFGDFPRCNGYDE